MINTDYVPEWYISPFQHVQYTLARNQLHMDLLFEDMGKADQFLDMGADAQVSTFSEGAYAIVQIGDTADKDQIQVYGLLLHEAVHIWQIVKREWVSANLALSLRHIQFKQSLKTYLKCTKKVR